MAHRRRETRGLNTNQVKDLNSAWHHAARIGRPLNALVSIRPMNIDSMSPAERCQLFATVRNKLGVYARSQRVPVTFAWSREANLDGAGEHMPARHRPHFDGLVIGWYPGPGEVDITTANQLTRLTWSGKRLSAIGYITKQMTPQAWYKRGLIRKTGGPVLGKRGGVTTNLDWRARDAFRTSPREIPLSAAIAAEQGRLREFQRRNSRRHER